MEGDRLFFALWPDDEVRARVAAAADELQSRHDTGGYRINPARYHITLFFLGDRLEAKRAEDIGAGIEARAFDLRLDQAGSFRNRQVPIWLGCREVPPACRELDRALRAALEEPVREPAPAFSPHLTIIRDAARPLATEPVGGIGWQIKEFVLVRSRLGRQARYEILRRYPLG